MFSSKNLYDMFKPVSNPNLITTLPVIIGGTKAVPNLISGAIIIHPLRTETLSQSFKDLKNVDIENEKVKSYSLVKTTYQLDIYKENSKNAITNEVEEIANNILEWLNSYEISEYLGSLKAGISVDGFVRHFTNIEHNQAFVNRAIIEFKISFYNEIFEKVNIFDKVDIENSLKFE